MASPQDDDQFSIIGTTYPAGQVRGAYESIYGQPLSDSDIQLTAALRHQYFEHILTAVPARNCNLIAYAAAGNATAELDTVTDTPIRWRGTIPPQTRGQPSHLGDATRFARYRYRWLSKEFIIYSAVICLHQSLPTMINYVLCEPSDGETISSRSKITDELIKTVAEWQLSDDRLVYVYDNYWTQSRSLWEEVQKASWDDVILDAGMKTALTDLIGKFFDSKAVYEDVGVPWKRGVIFHGPAGNGKTISLKAIMHTLSVRKDPVPTLYVKSAQYTYNIGQVFNEARRMAPCLLVFEDIDTVVTEKTRAYFFNEVDGLEGNDGIMMIASTNYLDRLDPGLSHRPSRFDRKYLFPTPDLAQRTQYCVYWRYKLRNHEAIKFPEKLCPAMAAIMDDFSFAYMKEAFVATLLVIAGKRTEGDGVIATDTELQERKGAQAPANHPQKMGVQNDESDDDLEEFEIWREMRKQVKILREDMDSKAPEACMSCGLSTAPGTNRTRDLSPGAEGPRNNREGWRGRVGATDGLGRQADTGTGQNCADYEGTSLRSRRGGGLVIHGGRNFGRDGRRCSGTAGGSRSTEMEFVPDFD